MAIRPGSPFCRPPVAPRLGLHGAWIGMCVELNVRGVLFLIRLADKRRMKSAAVEATKA